MFATNKITRTLLFWPGAGVCVVTKNSKRSRINKQNTVKMNDILLEFASVMKQFMTELINIMDS